VKMRTAWIGLVLALGACFDGEELTEGLPCRNNGDCGGAQLCVNFLCGEPDGGGGDDFGGNPCEIGGNVCVDANTLGVCDLDTQSTMSISCDERCESSGYAEAIGCRSTMGAKHDCYCDLSTLACDSATQDDSCTGNVLVECQINRIEITDCSEECQESGQLGQCETIYDDIAQVYNGQCTCVAGACNEGATFCQDDGNQAVCVSGVWQLQPCTDGLCHMSQCPDSYNYCPEDYDAQSLGCGYDGNSRTGCLCTI
jgi:hypothetical protein